MCLTKIWKFYHIKSLDNFMHSNMSLGNPLTNVKDWSFIRVDVYTSNHDSVSQYLYCYEDITRWYDHICNFIYWRVEVFTTWAKSEDYIMGNHILYITYIYDTTAHCSVTMNQKFMKPVLNIGALEGISLDLDPSIEMWMKNSVFLIKKI